MEYTCSLCRADGDQGPPDGGDPGGDSSDDDDPPRDSQTPGPSGSGNQLVGGRPSRLKLIPPEIYTGVDNDEFFWKYVQETNQYLEDGNVRPHRQVDIAARFVSGKAQEFYVQNILLSGEHWLLDQWYEELFDFCFPINYCDTSRTNLRRCYQNGRDVREYFYELNRYWNALGETTERTQVIKFWEGLDAWIEEELILDGYDVDVHSLKEVYARVQVLQKAK
ncbi:hypothetical protein FISHEDRAFT_39742, partial [Fistulina hepatica ATCC 64428]